MKIVQVHGKSMRPYLVDGDLLRLKNLDESSISFGSLVYGTNSSNEKVVHRYLGKNRVKGDRVKQFDEILSIDGVIVGRIFGQSESNLNRIDRRFVLGFLSLLNQKKFIFLNHISALLIHLFGKLLRGI